MKKQVQVIMLPTEKAKLEKGDLLLRHLWKGEPRLECRSIWQYKEHDKKLYNTEVITTLHGSFADVPSSFKPQHLYFLSNELIKKGDWYYSGMRTKEYGIHQATNQRLADIANEFKAKKVIATTDENLRIFTGVISTHVGNSLPRPSNEFLKKYCELGGIDKCLIEYYYECENGHTMDYGPGCVYPMCDKPNYLKLHTAPDNTISIYPIES